MDLPGIQHPHGEDAVGLRISIFCSEGFDPSLEGIITSFDHETGHHGILFDTGVQLDIDIAKERVSEPYLVCVSALTKAFLSCLGIGASGCLTRFPPSSHPLCV